jgi:hypothetical protein
MKFNGHHPRDLVVHFRGHIVTAQIHRGIAGRSFIALQGPFSGVSFYVDTHHHIIEISHPTLREQLTRDLDFEPMQRHLKPISWSYPDPETEPALKAALDRQVARVRSEQGTQIEIRHLPLNSVSVMNDINSIYGNTVTETLDLDPVPDSVTIADITTAAVGILNPHMGGVTNQVVKRIAEKTKLAQEKAKQLLTSLEIMAIVLEIIASVVNETYDASQIAERMETITVAMETLMPTQTPAVNPLLLRHFSHEELKAIVTQILDEKVP